MKTEVVESPTLDERVAAAFLDRATSKDVASLINDVATAVVASAEEAERARTHALDPALSAPEVARARRHMDDAAFRRDRLQEAAHRLAGRVKALRACEAQAQRLAAYEKAKEERDKLAEELRQEYPALAARLADLVARVDANDRDVEWINERALPSGVPRLDVAELVARGLGGFVDGSSNVPRITTQMRLPAFDYDRHSPYRWPRS